MKPFIAFIFACSWLLAAFAAAKAQEQIYLPLVSNAPGVQADFVAEPARLWDIYESGGSQAEAPQCGRPGRVQVHVFGKDGDTGPASRLDEVMVEVVHIENGVRSVEILATGADPAAPGMVEFALQGWAEIRIVKDVSLAAPSSDSVSVTAQPAGVEQTTLQHALYCTDAASCAALISTGQCAGTLSWTVVFKRSW